MRKESNGGKGIWAPVILGMREREWDGYIFNT